MHPSQARESCWGQERELEGPTLGFPRLLLASPCHKNEYNLN